MNQTNPPFRPLPPHYAATPGKLANAGFFQSSTANYHDRCVCFCCGITLVKWEAADDPWFVLFFNNSNSTRYGNLFWLLLSWKGNNNILLVSRLVFTCFELIIINNQDWTSYILQKLPICTRKRDRKYPITTYPILTYFFLS